MISKTRIVRTICTGLVVVTLGASFIGSASVAYGQPVGPSTGGCADIYSRTFGDNLPHPDAKNVPEGTVRSIDGVKSMCVGGRWVSCSDPSLTAQQQAACSAGVKPSTWTMANVTPSGTVTSPVIGGGTGSFSTGSAGTGLTFRR